MAMGLVDRLQTIAVTATLTSAVWLVVGATMLGREGLPWVTASSTAAPAKSAQRSIPAGSPSSSAQATSAPPRAAGPLLIPVRGVAPAQLTDTFSQARAGGARRHDAIDIMAPRGTPVIAAGAGRVEKLFISDAGGKTVYVRTPDGATIHYYAHLDAYAPGLVEGQAVAAGAVLGTVGSTGNASPEGPHLHFAVMQTSPDKKWWEEASALNPYPLLTARQPGAAPAR